MQALQARRGQKEQQEQQEQERQDNEQQQGESGESLPRMETASPYDRVCPCAAATRPAPGGLSWERLGRIALLGHALEILPKSLPEASREDHQEEQGESGEGRPRIETASAYYRL